VKAGQLVQYAGRILRPSPTRGPPKSMTTTTNSRVLASSLAKRAPGYTSLGFPDPRKPPGRRPLDLDCGHRTAQCQRGEKIGITSPESGTNSDSHSDYDTRFPQT
jgi:hypothetical protein